MSDKDCIFCRIVAGELSSSIEHEDEHALAFRDLNPQAPVHLLVIPRRHIRSVGELSPEEGEIASHLLQVVGQVARAQGLAEDGYRIVANVGDRGGQTVPHLHFHLLGGRQMTWPPG